jgi:hypothetical protein
MGLPRLCTAAALLLLGGCAVQSSLVPVELLDERTGMSLAALKEPVEFVQDEALAYGKRTSFAYLGPVEWNRMGEFRYALWIHIAPGNDKGAADIHEPGVVTLVLDDGPWVLSPIEPPSLGREAYHPVVSWGQTAYFDLNAKTLARLASSEMLQLNVRAEDGSTISFKPSHDARKPLSEYVRARGITGD